MRRNTDGAALRSKAETTRRLSKLHSSPETCTPPRGRSMRKLDHISQRYADLYDLAPTGYVSFDRSGRIEEINLTAAQLFGLPRERLIGMPFMVFVTLSASPAAVSLFGYARGDGAAAQGRKTQNHSCLSFQLTSRCLGAQRRIALPNCDYRSNPA